MIPSVVDTLIINGYEVRVRPTSFDAQPVAAQRNIIKLPCGPVEILWPGQQGRTLVLGVGYDNLDEDDAEAILVLSTMGGPGASLQFSRGGPLYTAKVLKCEMSESGRGWSVHLSGTLDWVPL